MSGSASPLLVQLPEESPAEAGALSCEVILEAWQAIEQALIQLEHLSPAQAWQVLLAPYGLQVVPPDPAAGSSPPSAAAGGGGENP
ncbi:hypothetical protein [Thermogemmatispora carboxidivorans]|uniref:hypothetical protein n=1 Tax=Thermogemmatispora carboxidivorans TaxID=1382306 RepID=UPI00069C9F2E|nr:hypothetical protein [Thermogemmatispora carboxidivorans]